MLLLMAATLYFFAERGGNQYGPRFHYEVFPFLVLFVVANVFRDGLFLEKPRRDRVIFALLVVSVSAMPVAFVVHAVFERRVVRERMDPYYMVAASGLRQALVLIDGRVGTARSMAAFDLTRNGLNHLGSVLYGLDPGAGGQCAPGVRIPGRTTYLYAWNRAGSYGTLRPLECPPRAP